MLIFTLVACPDKEKIVLDQTVWELEKTTQGSLVKSSTERPPSLTFSVDKGQFSGFGGCNRVMGEFELDKNNIKIMRIGSTKMNCPNIAAEKLFMSSLNQVNNYQLKGRQLILLKDRSEVLVFKMLDQ